MVRLIEQLYLNFLFSKEIWILPYNYHQKCSIFGKIFSHDILLENILLNNKWQRLFNFQKSRKKGWSCKYRAQEGPNYYTNLLEGYILLFVCLFVWSLSSHSRIFHSYEDVTIAGEGLQIWPMLGTHVHWATRVLRRATPTVTRAYPL